MLAKRSHYKEKRNFDKLRLTFCLEKNQCLYMTKALTYVIQRKIKSRMYTESHFPLIRSVT